MKVTKGRVAGWVAGGGLAAIIYAGGPHVSEMFKTYLEHRRMMAFAMTQTEEHNLRVKECELPEEEGGLGGHWYRGDCLVAFEREVPP